MVPMSLVSEDWITVGTTVQDGLPVVYVARRLHEATPRTTVYKLVHFPAKGWRNMGQFLSTGIWRSCPERYGVKLSDSRLDRILLWHALEARVV